MFYSEGLKCLQGGTEDTKDVGKSKEFGVSGSTDSTTSIRAVYELTAMVAHVHDDFDTDKPFQEESEGHLVAHVKVMNVSITYCLFSLLTAFCLSFSNLLLNLNVYPNM